MSTHIDQDMRNRMLTYDQRVTAHRMAGLLVGAAAQGVYGEADIWLAAEPNWGYRCYLGRCRFDAPAKDRAACTIARILAEQWWPEVQSLPVDLEFDQLVPEDQQDLDLLSPDELDAGLDRATEFLTRYRRQFDEIVDVLLRHESIAAAQVRKIFGP